MHEQQPYRIAADTWVVPHLLPAGPNGSIYLNSLVITGSEPVIVDTGAPTFSDSWLDKVWSIIDPKDVRWIFLSHDDADHAGNLVQVLDSCPQARLVTTAVATGRLASDHGVMLPMPRCRWVNAGEAFDAGDRRLVAVRPPVFDSPTTRGLLDTRTGVLWGVDAFGTFVDSQVEDFGDLPLDTRWDRFSYFQRVVAPWHEWLDADRYTAHIDRLESMDVRTVATAHGPAIPGALVPLALDRLRELPLLPPAEQPGQTVLDALLAGPPRTDEGAAA